MYFKMVGILWLVVSLSCGLPLPSFGLTVINSLPFTASTSGETYELSGDLSSTGNGISVTGNNITIDLKGHTLTFGTDNAENQYGIYIDWNKSGITIHSTVIGGEIVHGATTNPAGCHGIFFQEVSTSPNVHDIRIEVNSQADGDSQSSGIFARRARNPVFYNNHIVNNASAVANRHSVPVSGIAAELDSVTATSTGKIYNNTVYSTHQGIRVTGKSASSTSEPAVDIYGNTIEINQVAVNAYAIVARAGDDMSIHDNLISTSGSGGRGILIEHGDNFHVYDNTITVGEAETAESVWTNGIRQRYGVTNSVIEDNFVTVLCGQNGYSGGSGIKPVSAANIDLGNPQDVNNIIRNNSIVASNGSSTYTCAAFHTDGLQSGHNYTIIGNNITSNDIAVYVQSTSAAIPIAGMVMRNTSITKTSPPSGKTFSAFYFYLYPEAASIDAEFQCTQYSGGALETDVVMQNPQGGSLDYIFGCPGRKYRLLIAD